LLRDLGRWNRRWGIRERARRMTGSVEECGDSRGARSGILGASEGQNAVRFSYAQNAVRSFYAPIRKLLFETSAWLLDKVRERVAEPETRRLLMGA
jgi:hypothetical protein